MDYKITRIWHGLVNKEDLDEYVKYVKSTGLSDYIKVEGCLSAKLLTRVEGKRAHILTISEWDSYESIMKFAGKNYHLAKYYDEDKRYLLEFEKNVRHFMTHQL